MSDERILIGVRHEYVITWDRHFSGWPTRMELVQGPRGFDRVTLTWDHEPKTLIREVPIEVLRKIVAMADGLPKPALDTTGNDQ